MIDALARHWAGVPLVDAGQPYWLVKKDTMPDGHVEGVPPRGGLRGAVQGAVGQVLTHADRGSGTEYLGAGPAVWFTTRLERQELVMFVLVHGAGMGANCWDRLLPHLDRPAIAVDLPGRGSRADVTSRPWTSTTAPARSSTTSPQADARRPGACRTLVRRCLGATRDGRARAAPAPRRLPLGGRAARQHRRPGPDRSGGPRARARARSPAASTPRTARAPARCCATTWTPSRRDWTLDRVVDDSAALLTEHVDLSGLSADVPRHLRPADERRLLSAGPPGTVGRTRGWRRGVPRHRSHGDGVRAAAGREAPQTTWSDG